jgi:hypothetical protein
MATLLLVFIYSVPVVIALATLEALIRSSRTRGAYDWRAYFASLTDLLVRQYLVYALLPLGLADPVIAPFLIVSGKGEKTRYLPLHRCIPGPTR